MLAELISPIAVVTFGTLAEAEVGALQLRRGGGRSSTASGDVPKYRAQNTTSDDHLLEL